MESIVERAEQVTRERDEARRERDVWRDRAEAAWKSLSELRGERDEARRERDGARRGMDWWKGIAGSLSKERDKALRERDEAVEKLNDIVDEFREWRNGLIPQLRKDRDNAHKERDEATQELDAVRRERDDLVVALMERVVEMGKERADPKGPIPGPVRRHLNYLEERILALENLSDEGTDPRTTA